MLFINVGAKCISASLACYTQTNPPEPNRRYDYYFDTEKNCEEISTEVLYSLTCTDFHLESVATERGQDGLIAFLD